MPVHRDKVTGAGCVGFFRADITTLVRPRWNDLSRTPTLRVIVRPLGQSRSRNLQNKSSIASPTPETE